MNFEFEDLDLQQCQAVFNSLPSEERLFKTHYMLAKETRIKDSTTWKAFLMDTRVADWINQELTLFKDAQLRIMIKDATVRGNSVGAAQMMNALNKSFESDTSKEGAVFVYNYIPLNEREQGAPNTNVLTRDIFERGE